MNPGPVRWTTASLRAVAIAIALVAVVDPVTTAERDVRHTVAVVAAEQAEDSRALRDDVAQRLGARYDVVDRVMPGAAATVVVGDRLPESAAAIGGPAFVVLPGPTGPSVAIVSIISIDAPREVPFASRAPVRPRVRVRGAAGRQMDVTLRQGEATIDRVERTIASDDETVALGLDFVPVSRGASVLSVSAVLRDVPRARADADVAVDVVDRAWRVLFYDPRPSWASTFVRRAIERDARFSVRSRTKTSTGLAVERGDVPPTLRDDDRLDEYDAIVVGAPAALGPADIAALGTFARHRGGAVVVLLDEAGSGPLAGLIGTTAWTASVTPTPTAIETEIPSQAGLAATELVAPLQVPPGARSLAHAPMTGTRRVVAFEVPTGAGRVIVSGLVDAWRYRGTPEASAFDGFWRETIGAAAAASPAALTVVPSSALLVPGARTTVAFTIRRVASDPPASGTSHLRVTASGPESVDAAVEGRASVPLRVWPSGLPGHFAGEFLAPTATGRYRLVAESGSARGEARVVVAARASTSRADETDALAAWVRTRGGRSFADTDVGGLERALGETLLPEQRRAPWWPMRSSWWIVALAGALGAEWWLRRRADLR